MEPTPSRLTRTVITDVDIPFGRMVVIILKWMLASIPAVLLLYAFFGILALLFAALIGGGGSLIEAIYR